MRGGEAIIESLKNMGVKTIFGYPGGQTIPFYDMLYDADMLLMLQTVMQGHLVVWECAWQLPVLEQPIL